MKDSIVWQGDTPFGHYQIIDTVYDGRPARVLYSGQKRAAQSGVARDTERDLLFDYNQRLFELATNLVPKRVLLIGGAVATLPLALLAALQDVHIDIVEPDKQLLELAHRYFDLPRTNQLQTFFVDGMNFLEAHDQRYDLVVIDAFAHTTIPPELRTDEAWAQYVAHLEPGGVVAMNIISSYHGSGSHVLGGLFASATAAFTTVDLFLASRGYSLWLPQNIILVAHNRSDIALKDYVRADALDPPSLRRNLLDS